MPRGGCCGIWTARRPRTTRPRAGGGDTTRLRRVSVASVRLGEGATLSFLASRAGVGHCCCFAAEACWPCPLPIPDRPLLHDGMPHRTHVERQVSHYGQKRPQAPRAAWGRGSVARPL